MIVATKFFAVAAHLLPQQGIGHFDSRCTQLPFFIGQYIALVFSDFAIVAQIDTGFENS